MKRKSFLKTAAIAAAGILLIPTGIYFATPQKKEFAYNFIKNKLDYLQLDDDGVKKFIDDYFASNANNLQYNLRWKAYYLLSAGTEKSKGLFELVRTYLLSSDFFVNKMDTKKTVKYIGIFNTYTSPVANPYSYIYSYK